ncbi:MAG TPA: hypothetical protein VHC18_27540 [Amycolatopsis sp.]|nr:hypothetical protein [Amycolatopsis sp.]
MIRHTELAGTVAGVLAGGALLGLGIGLGHAWLTVLGIVLVLSGLCLWALATYRNQRRAPDSGASEQDVSRDPGVASSRVRGGVPDPDAADQHSTTGPTPNQTYVGRITGADIGSAETTGAEKRAWRDPRRSG